MASPVTLMSLIVISEAKQNMIFVCCSSIDIWAAMLSNATGKKKTVFATVWEETSVWCQPGCVVVWLLTYEPTISLSQILYQTQTPILGTSEAISCAFSIKSMNSAR